MTDVALSPRSSALFGSLDTKQREAVESTSKRLLIVAAPGSGKTRTIQARIVHLLERRGLPSHAVLAFCFTRAAARELKRRVVETVGDELGSLVEAQTFHAWALRMLRAHDLLPEGVHVASEEEEAEVVASIFGGPEARPEAKGKRKAFDEARMRYHATGSTGDIDPVLISLIGLVIRRLEERRLVSHGDILIRLRVAMSYDILRPSLDRYAHVLVDEGHDVTPLERAIVDGLDAEQTWVLDHRQAIFGWRGATVAKDLVFDRSFDVVQLDRSYRFGMEIAGFATRILPDAPVYGPPDLPGTVVELEREKVAGGLSTYVTCLLGRHGPREIAVLGRWHSQVEFAAQEIGPRAVHVRRTEPEALRAAQALGRLVLDGQDDAAFRTLWRLDGRSGTDLRVLMEAAGAARSLFAQWLRGGSFFGLLGSAREIPFAAGPVTWSRVAEAVYGFPNLAGSTELLEASRGLETSSIRDALDALSERADDDAFARARADGRIPCATVHAAKGREWDAVVVLTSPTWPPAAARDARQEEDRRVFFVASTRARKELVILRESRPW